MDSDIRAQLQESLGSAFTLERELGGGGMSRVFLATETALGRAVVIKVLPAEAEGAVSAERFRREIALVARLQHPTIVPLLTAGVAAGLLYYTMPFIEGRTLRTELERDGSLTVERVTSVLRDVLEALAYAHAQGVVHRDIKPENVLLAPHHAVVSDFGVAKALAAAAGSDASGATTAGFVLGTPAYMAPEQAAADPNTDHRADLYAVGVLAYEMLAGATPFADRAPSMQIAAHLTERPAPVESRRADAPRALAALVMQLLEKDPAKRPPSADDALRSLAGSTVARHGPPLAAVRNAAVALVVLAILTAGLVRLRSQPRSPMGARTPSIAVLPFDDMSAKHDAAYLSDGISEELIGALSKVPGLRVVGRSSSFAVRGKGLDGAEIGRRLDVGALLEGSVQQSGEKLRVTAQLVDAATGTVLWNERYDRDLRDLFAVQDELTSAIVSQLRLRLAGDRGISVSATTGDVEAYTLYLQGRYFWNRRTKESLLLALDYFRRALARDSSYARAYAGIADTYNVMGGLAYLPQLEVAPLARVAALRAIALDPKLAEAHSALGFNLMYIDWDLTRSRSEFERALALDPNYATAEMYLGWTFMAIGQFDSGLVHEARARDLDPLSLINNLRLADAYLDARRFDEALAQYRHTFELDSAFAPLGVRYGRALVAKGDLDAARGEFARLDRPDHPYTRGDRVLTYVKAGFPDSARRIFALEPPRPEDEISRAYAFMALGDLDSAFAALRRGADRREVLITLMAIDPLLDPLRADPRYAALVRRIGFLP